MPLVLRTLRRSDEKQFVAGWGDHPFSYYELGASFDEFLVRLDAIAAGIDLPIDHVANVQLFGDVAGVLVGRLALRHELTGVLQTIGGHIGYSVLQQHRRLGYGTEMLTQALPIAAALGLTHVLVTCDATNIGSRKIIEANGGIYESQLTAGLEVPKLRYWIDTTR